MRPAAGGHQEGCGADTGSAGGRVVQRCPPYCYMAPCSPLCRPCFQHQASLPDTRDAHRAPFSMNAPYSHTPAEQPGGTLPSRQGVRVASVSRRQCRALGRLHRLGRTKRKRTRHWLRQCYSSFLRTYSEVTAAFDATVPRAASRLHSCRAHWRSRARQTGALHA